MSNRPDAPVLTSTPSIMIKVCDALAPRIIKAAPMRGAFTLHDLERFHTAFHLLDGHVEGMRGGTGETFDWELVRARRSKVPLILSGGLTPENVAEAIAVVQPYAVDTASATESAPGHKDPERLRAFFAAVAAVAPGSEQPATIGQPA